MSLQKSQYPAEYIELDSTYRDRNQFPDAGSFEVQLSSSGVQTDPLAMKDPVSKQANILMGDTLNPWYLYVHNQNQLPVIYSTSANITTLRGEVSTPALSTTRNTVMLEVKINDLSSGEQTFTVYPTTSDTLLEMDGAYIGCIFSEQNPYITEVDAASQNRARILSYTYLGHQQGRITLDSPLVVDTTKSFFIQSTSIGNVADSVTPSVTGEIFVPFGSDASNTYVGMFLINETREEWRRIIEYNGDVHVAMLNISGSLTSSSGPINLWQVWDRVSIRAEAPQSFGNVQLDGTIMVGTNAIPVYGNKLLGQLTLGLQMYTSATSDPIVPINRAVENICRSTGNGNVAFRGDRIVSLSDTTVTSKVSGTFSSGSFNQATGIVTINFLSMTGGAFVPGEHFQIRNSSFPQLQRLEGFIAISASTTQVTFFFPDAFNTQNPAISSGIAGNITAIITGNKIANVVHFDGTKSLYTADYTFMQLSSADDGAEWFEENASKRTVMFPLHDDKKSGVPVKAGDFIEPSFGNVFSSRLQSVGTSDHDTLNNQDLVIGIWNNDDPNLPSEVVVDTTVEKNCLSGVNIGDRIVPLPRRSGVLESATYATNTVVVGYSVGEGALHNAVSSGSMVQKLNFANVTTAAQYSQWKVGTQVTQATSTAEGTLMFDRNGIPQGETQSIFVRLSGATAFTGTGEVSVGGLLWAGTNSAPSVGVPFMSVLYVSPPPVLAPGAGKTSIAIVGSGGKSFGVQVDMRSWVGDQLLITEPNAQPTYKDAYNGMTVVVSTSQANIGNPNLVIESYIRGYDRNTGVLTVNPPLSPEAWDTEFTMAISNGGFTITSNSKPRQFRIGTPVTGRTGTTPPYARGEYIGAITNGATPDADEYKIYDINGNVLTLVGTGTLNINLARNVVTIIPMRETKQVLRCAKFTGRLDTGVSIGSTSVIFPSSNELGMGYHGTASTVNGAYNGLYITLGNNQGVQWNPTKPSPIPNRQTRVITSYDALTRTATVDRPFTRSFRSISDAAVITPLNITLTGITSSLLTLGRFSVDISKSPFNSISPTVVEMNSYVGRAVYSTTLPVANALIQEGAFVSDFAYYAAYDNQQYSYPDGYYITVSNPDGSYPDWSGLTSSESQFLNLGPVQPDHFRINSAITCENFPCSIPVNLSSSAFGNNVSVSSMLPVTSIVTQTTRDNAFPLLYSGSLVSQNQMVCYEIELMGLVLPNAPVEGGLGGKIAYYPYVYVQLENVSGASAGNSINMYSNNPNSRRMMFRAAINDYSRGLGMTTVSPFINIGGNDQVMTVKFKPNDSLRVSVRLPNGDVFKTILSETHSPEPPNPYAQVSMMFRIRRLR